jgi:hypothetical protein
MKCQLTSQRTYPKSNSIIISLKKNVNFDIIEKAPYEFYPLFSLVKDNVCYEFSNYVYNSPVILAGEIFVSMKDDKIFDIT